MFDACVNNLAQHGRLVVIGWISGYQTDKGFNTSKTASSLPQRLLPKCASIRGFFLFGYVKEIKVCYFIELLYILGEYVLRVRVVIFWLHFEMLLVLNAHTGNTLRDFKLTSSYK